MVEDDEGGEGETHPGQGGGGGETVQHFGARETYLRTRGSSHSVLNIVLFGINCSIALY